MSKSIKNGKITDKEIATKLIKAFKKTVKFNPLGVRLYYHTCAIVGEPNGVYSNVGIRMNGDKSVRARSCKSSTKVTYIDGIAHVDDMYIYEMLKLSRASVGDIPSLNVIHTMMQCYRRNRRAIMGVSTPNQAPSKLCKKHLMLLKSAVIDLGKHGIIIDSKLCKLLYKLDKSGIPLDRVSENRSDIFINI